MLQVRGGALFIVLQGRYEAWRQLQAGKVGVLVFHAKPKLGTLQSGAARPPLSRGPGDVAVWPSPLRGRL